MFKPEGRTTRVSLMLACETSPLEPTSAGVSVDRDVDTDLRCSHALQFGIFPDRAPACFPKSRRGAAITTNPMPLQQLTGPTGLVKGEVRGNGGAVPSSPVPEPVKGDILYPLRRGQAMTPPIPDGWLTRQQAAARLSIGLRTLDLWRSLGWGPPAALVPCWGDGGRRRCLYRKADIVSFRTLMLPRQYGRHVLLEAPGGRIFSRAGRRVKRTGQMPPLSAVLQASAVKRDAGGQA